jgi:hypothetical protein
LANSLILALVTGIQSAQVLELKESFDPTDVGSLDPRHKGEDEGHWGIVLVNQASSGFVSSLKPPFAAAFLLAAIARKKVISIGRFSAPPG